MNAPSIEPMRQSGSSAVHDQALAAKWREVLSSTKSLWDRIEIHDRAFVLRLDDGSLFHLSSFAERDLPPLEREFPLLGRFLLKHSVYANIMARRRGREEVTFYCLRSEPHGSGFDRKIDAKMVAMGAAPLNWRRQMVVETVRKTLLGLLSRGASSFTFLDIGCGGGFDGLELKRLLVAMEEKGVPIPEHRIINVDIDDKWLELNARLAKRMLPERHQGQITRRNVSIFDYLKSAELTSDLAGTENLIISCNGFADFCEDAALNELYGGICELMRRTPGEATVVLPLALKNPVQEVISKWVGFGYNARERPEITSRLAQMFRGLQLEQHENHSQLTFIIRKPAS